MLDFELITTVNLLINTVLLVFLIGFVIRIAKKVNALNKKEKFDSADRNENK